MSKEIKSLKFEGVDYDRDELEKMAAEGEASFTDAMNKTGFKHLHVGDGREEKIKELFATVAPKAETAQAAPEATTQTTQEATDTTDATAKGRNKNK
jgi:hypothetical protein